MIGGILGTMPRSIRDALRVIDGKRQEWWIVRRDSEAPGIWHAVLDPKSEWDWAYKIGRSKWLAQHRIARARQESRTGQRLMHLRRLVDTIRNSGGQSAC